MRLLPTKQITDWVIAAGTLLTVATLIGGGLVYAVRLRDGTASMRSDTDHEARLRVIENVVSDVRADVRVTKTDVSWIRTFLDPHRRPAERAQKAAQTASNE